ncbi:MAG: hypothetical protein AAGF32_08625, partial [Pseudomonadota bacterium]
MLCRHIERRPLHRRCYALAACALLLAGVAVLPAVGSRALAQSAAAPGETGTRVFANAQLEREIQRYLTSVRRAFPTAKKLSRSALRKELARVRAALSEGRFTDALRRAHVLLRRDDDRPLYWTQIARAHAGLAAQNQNRAYQQRNFALTAAYAAARFARDEDVRGEALLELAARYISLQRWRPAITAVKASTALIGATPRTAELEAT